jgi:hypothetical protein
MLTTEKQAREKWCPWTRTGYRGIGLNRQSVGNSSDRDGILHDTRCIASDCMAWRESRTLQNFGHCGLAGTPVGDDAGAAP